MTAQNPARILLHARQDGPFIMTLRKMLFPLGVLLFAAMASAAPPSRWIPRGAGGGGAFFGPSISPHNPDEIFVASDMSDLFHSTDMGASWQMLNFRQMQGNNRMTWIQFTSKTNVLYALNGSIPAKSTDGGATWTHIAPDPWWSGAYCVFADPERTNRLFMSDYTTLFFSQDGGAIYSAKYETNDFHIAGAFFDGPTIYIGSSAGLLVSTNSGTNFTLSAIGGIPSDEAMISFSGARESGTNRLYCVTWYGGDVYPGISGSDFYGYRAVYRLDHGFSPSWTRITNGFGNDMMTFISLTRTNICVAYAAGATEYPEYPVVYKTMNGGDTWTKIFRVNNNDNILTGWQGDDPGPWNWQKWSFGGNAMGFNVCPTDPKRAAITDYGFVHITTNGGASWSQAYVHRSDQNATNAATPRGRSYHSVGLENTSCWWIEWANSNRMTACYTDIRGEHSGDGGITWGFPTGLLHNSSYEALKHPTNGRTYLAASSVHDMYAWDAYCQDSAIDGGTGTVMVSSDGGMNWSPLPQFRYPAVALAVNPTNLNRMYVSGVHSANGGIFFSSNFQSGAGATWTKLANPPRTQGHPYKIHVLSDGTLVCSYSARISGDFTDSSGVFVSTNGGAAWLDRSDAGMRYYTKDVIIDPHDPSQRVWYAGVWGEWGNSSGLGGLYRTTNRGVAWTRITMGIDQVGSCAVTPWNSNEVYITTENQGLWYCTNARAAAPAFMEITSYPFRHPTRVFFNPFNSNEIWVTSYGGGMMMGRVREPEPRITFAEHPSNQQAKVDIAAEGGQRVVFIASENLAQWQDVETNTVLDNTLRFLDTRSTNFQQRFYGAKID